MVRTTKAQKELLDRLTLTMDTDFFIAEEFGFNAIVITSFVGTYEMKNLDKEFSQIFYQPNSGIVVGNIASWDNYPYLDNQDYKGNKTAIVGNLS